MGSPCIWNLNLIYSIVSLAAAAAQPDLLYHVCTDTYGNYTSNSTYSENLNTLLSDITSNTRIDYGFYNLSSGQGSNEVHGIGLCRGDLNLSTCHSCLNDSSYKLRENCPNRREAIGWYDNCMLRYSHRSIFGVMEEAPAYILLNPHNVRSAFQFSSTLGSLLSRLGDKSSAGDSELKYATESANFTDSEFEYETETESTVYALAQCTPDLSQIDCSNCINDSRNHLLYGSRVRRGGRFLTPSCILRYEMYPFAYEQDNTSAPSSPPPSSPPPSPSPSSPPSSSPAATTTATGRGSRRKGSKGKGSNRTKIATILTVITSVVFISIVVLVLCCVRRRRKKETLMKDKNDDEIRRIESLEYNLNTIRAATRNFSDEKKLGRGGFGVVYQGTLSNGQEIAVKRLAKNSGQGEVEFKNEVLLVAKLQHRNLIKFLGFCLEEEEKLLIYELVKNRSLDYFLFNEERRVLLDWKKRYKIIDGVTRGMIYLHEDSRLRIIHRDLKASNILLDSEMNAKIADFGMARLFHADQIHANTSRIVGTYGYMAPEYALHGFFSIKSDVYSFGVLVLEIICGQRNNGFCSGENVENLITWVWRNWKEETILSVVDPIILVGSRSEIMRCIHIGLLCVQESVRDRPTMSSVILMLGSQSLSLPRPSEPAFISYFQDRSLVELRSNLTQHTEIEISMTEEFGPR